MPEIIRFIPTEEPKGYQWYYIAMTFLIFAGWKLIGFHPHYGTIIAFLGVGLIAPFLALLYVIRGIVTKRWYAIHIKTETIIGDIIVGTACLFIIVFTLWLWGLFAQPYPTWDIIWYFTIGVVAWWLIKWVFRSFAEADHKAWGLVFGTAIGILSGYVLASIPPLP